VDFRWHRNTPSPHWSVIPPSERMSVLPPDVAQAGWSVKSSDLQILNVNGGIEEQGKEGDDHGVEVEGGERGGGGSEVLLGSNPSIAVEGEEEEL
jgi:hypothetical protein